MSELVLPLASMSLAVEARHSESEAPSEVRDRKQVEADALATMHSTANAQDDGRFSTSSSSSDSPRGVEAAARVGDEEEREKLATDSGYESDRRRSFSFSGAVDGEESGTPVQQEDAASGDAVSLPSEEETPRQNEISRQKKEIKPASVVKEIQPPLPLMPPHPWPLMRPVVPLLHPWLQQQLAIQHQAMLAHAQLVRPHPPHPAMPLKQAEAAMDIPRGRPWEQYLKMIGTEKQNPPARQIETPKSTQPLPPVVLPLPVCCKASAVGPKEARKYAIPKYAVGFVIGLNGTRIQATRDVSGATILLLGDADDQTVIGIFGTQGQIHDAVYLMKQNIMRHSGMFIGDIDGMLKQIAD